MITAIIFIIFLAILIITHEFGHFIAAKMFGVRVDEFAFGFPPKIFSKKKGDTTYSINAIPFGGFVKLYGENEEGIDANEDPRRSFYGQPAWKRAIVISAGVVMNFLVGWFAFATVIFFVGQPQSIYIKEVIQNSPAALAGFTEGEKIEGFKKIEDFQSFISKNLGSEIVVNNKNITPRENPPEGEGSLGVILEDGDFVKYQFFQSIFLGFMSAVFIIKQIFLSLASLFVGIFAGENVMSSLAGPVGIFNEVGRAASVGVLYLINFLGILSLNLAVFNMLPVPALDGGRLLFIGIEKIIGRRLNVKYEAIANLIGFALLILLAILVTIGDITKLG